MPPTPRTPPELLGAPFHLRDAFAAGLTRHQLASRCWVRLFRQVYVHHAVELTDQMRFDAARLIVPSDAAAIGLTAAWLYGIWTPEPGVAVPMHFGLPLHRGAFNTTEAAGRRVVLNEGDTDELEGVLVTTPERTCFGLMTAGTPTEAVVWADAFLHSGTTTADGLRRYADERPHWPHVRKVRAAVERARVGAASPMETRLRLVIVDGGLPEPTWLNKPLYDKHGAFLGEPAMGYDRAAMERPLFGIDLTDLPSGNTDQQAKGHGRDNGLLMGGIPMLRYTRHDLYREPSRIVREVGTMLHRHSAA